MVRLMLVISFLLLFVLDLARTSPTNPPTTPFDFDDNLLFDFDDDNPSLSSDSAGSSDASDSTTLASSQLTSTSPLGGKFMITCPGAPPAVLDDGFSWPESRPITNYDSLFSLCYPTRSTAPPGLGCRCASPGRSSKVECDRDTADPALYATSLRPFCETQCSCLLEPEKEEEDNLPRGLAVLARSRSRGWSGTLGRTRSDWMSNGLFGSAADGLLAIEEGAGRQSGWGGGNARSRSAWKLYERKRKKELRGMCGSGSCKEGCGDGCGCELKGERVDPLSRMRFFSGICASQSFLGKRDQAPLVEQACPCNGTYISRKCCDVGVGGVVWERPELKLGEMIEGSW